LVRVQMLNENGYDASFVGDVRFNFYWGNVSFSKMEIAIRIFFFVTSIIVLVIFFFPNAKDRV